MHIYTHTMHACKPNFWGALRSAANCLVRAVATLCRLVYVDIVYNAFPQSSPVSFAGYLLRVRQAASYVAQWKVFRAHTFLS